MKFYTLYVSSCSATFELENNLVYYSDKSYDVKLNGEVVLKDVKTNVFTIYNLKPDCKYEVSIGEDKLSVITKKVSVILRASMFKNESNTQDDTLMLQSAIACLPKDGMLVIDGIYKVTSLFLKSDMTLVIEKGSALLGNIEAKEYPVMPGEVERLDSPLKMQCALWEGNPFNGKSSIINAFHVNNVDIVGEGIVDGRAQESIFWVNHKNHPWGRPRILFFNDSTNINVVGITVQNTGCWTVHPYFCENVGFYSMNIINPKISPNTDGMDPEGCKNLKIIGLNISVGDDCIALKSGKIYIGSTYKRPCENVQIRNCFMHDGHGAIVIGSEIGAGVKNVSLERCLFENTDRGLRIKTRRGRGKDSVVDNVVFSNIVMDGVLAPLVINMFYFCDPDGHDEYVQTREKLPVDERTPYIGHFLFENIKAYNAEYALGWFFGLPEAPIAGVEIRDSEFTVKENAGFGFPAMMDGIDKQSKTGFYFENVKSVKISNVKASGYVGNEYVLNNVESFEEK